MIPLLLFAAGALTFSVLTLHYWRKGGRRDPVFAAFAAACAAAFLINILSRAEALEKLPLIAVLDLVTGLMPPLLLHLVARDRNRWLQFVFYGIGGAAAVLVALDDASLITLPLRDQVPSVVLAAAGMLGLVSAQSEDRRLLWWYRVLLGLTVVAAVAGLFAPSAPTVLAPDYLLLSFFCVTLYYRERVIFFDLLIKRGVFCACFLAAVAGLLSVVRDRITLLLVLMPLLLIAPWADGVLGRWIDRAFLGRRYTREEAERLFSCELQLAATGEDLCRRAERCLSDIFQCAAAVRVEKQEVPEAAGCLVADLDCGHVVLGERTTGIPYMTGDRPLFDSLVRTLRVMLENVRFREEQSRQIEREQQLRLLASRAELKALRAQINPHFLFNTLNTIAAFVPSRPDLADEAIEQLAQVFRYTLRKSESEWARLDEEAEFAAAYLRLEQARFGERLRVTLSLDPDAGAVSVPAMCIQPLIENAIRHGVSAREGEGSVGLRIRVNGSTAWIEVSDNGPGFPSDFVLGASPGHGLRNVCERLRGYYGDSARLCWERDANATRVLVQVPRRIG